MDERHIEKKILEYHNRNDGGNIPVYDNVVLIGETIASLDGDDKDCVAIILHDGSRLEHVFHISLMAALKLSSGLQQLLEEDEDELD